MNYRFWAFENDSAVKLTLRPGQSISHWRQSRTEEGWESSGSTWIHDGAGVRLEWTEDGRDCDGRLSQSGECFAAAEDLRAGNAAEGVVFPKWDTLTTAQRDYQAEAANY